MKHNNIFSYLTFVGSKAVLSIILVLIFLQQGLAQPPHAASKVNEQDVFSLRKAHSQAKPEIYAQIIQESLLKKHLYILASDSLEGRETGTIGNLKAAQYIANQFKSLKLDPTSTNGSFFQPMILGSVSWSKISLIADGEEQKHQLDYVSFPTYNTDMSLTAVKEVVYLGFGIEDDRWNDYQGVDVKDKFILIYKGEPQTKEGVSLITGSTTFSSWSEDLVRKLKIARKYGVKGVFVIESELAKTVDKNRQLLSGKGAAMQSTIGLAKELAPSIMISSTVLSKMLGRKLKKLIKLRDKSIKKGKPAHSNYSLRNTTIEMQRNDKTLHTQNVAALLPGADPDLKDEVLVISAHYDHLGKRDKTIFYGADDNGSGTSSVLSIAEAFTNARDQGLRPRRSILFLFFTGEEKGLLGSAYFVQQPLIPLNQIIADLNVDMIGRKDKRHENENYVYVIGADKLSQELHDWHEAVNKKYLNLELDYTFNDEKDPNQFYYRSDHYNFAKNNIPVIFYFSGVHEDYHKPTDTPDKILYTKTRDIARHVFHTAWMLANSDAKPKLTKQEKQK